MLRRWQAARRRDRVGFRGQSLVEFALVTPLFIILIVGILEAGRVTHSVAVLAYGVNQGGRFAALPYSSCISGGEGALDAAAVQSHISARAANLGLAGVTAGAVTLDDNTAYPANNTSLTPNPRCNKRGRQVVVTASYNYRPVVGWIFGRAQIPLTRKAAFMME